MVWLGLFLWRTFEHQTNSNNMKTFKQILLILMLAGTLFACKKEKNDELGSQEILKKKILDIIPKEYQDSLIKMGIAINQDVTPPNLNGAFLLKTLKLVASNVPQDKAGKTFGDVKIKFFGQDSENNIKFISIQSNITDTSIVTAISGSGNKFTVYGKRKSVSGVNSAIFGTIYSGEIENNVIKNLRYGIINIDNSKGGTTFIKQGEGRVIKDDDMVSESIPMF